MKRLSTILAIATLSVTAFVAELAASPITFIFTGQGSGSLDGNSFGLSSFTITAYGDTDNLQPSPYGSGWYIDHDSASITIQSLGSYDFTEGTLTFFNYEYNVPGISRAEGSDLFDGPFDAPAMVGWDMLSSIGPVAGKFMLLQWWGGVETDAGLLVFDTNLDTTGTFQAIVGSSVPDTGATLSLLALSMIGLASFRRRFTA